jgi:molybdate/tungstate transport system substrate-binding protein
MEEEGEGGWTIIARLPAGEPYFIAMPRSSALRAAFALASLAACHRPESRPSVAGRDTVAVYAAASLAGPLRALADTYAASTGTVSQIEIGGSLEHARKLTELHRIPDVLVLADYEVLAALMPRYVHWYLAFANNRIVIAYNDHSRGGARINTANWPDVLESPGVAIGRPDPSTAPAGYRALIMLQLAQRTMRRPGLAARVLANAGPRYMRPNAGELAALLDAGAVDYIIDYESVARAHHFQYVSLPVTIDLSDPTMAAQYARAFVRVQGANGDTVTMRGQPILYALAIPDSAPHPEAARRWVAELLGPIGSRDLATGFVSVLARPRLVGTGAPPEVTAHVAR